ncbi:hypothetical protein GTQ43_33185 [Nostoc sp. KVJ3]|uniref:hypothetical protein n=1 Tax=Nostoc sp. KVJ3 TaxID=457945 RepID=UPI0022376242|nr:hypothetical protein [Nostoc sp. KVJ3]MCW5318403.1 hypothetical protein [Nostoc sp. KVJ3]
MQRFHYNGRIIDRKTQAPIDGAKVILEVRGAPSVVYSDTEGIFKFTVNFDDDNIRSGQVWVEADSYEKYNRLIELLPANTDLGNFRLKNANAPDNKTNFLDGIPIQVKVAILTAVIGSIIVLVATKIISSLSLLEGSSSYKEDGTLVRGYHSDPIYIMEAGQRRWIPDFETLACLHGLNQNPDIPIDDLNHIPRGPHLPSRKNGALLKLIDSDDIYIMKDCQRRFIANNLENLDQKLHRDAIQSVYEVDLKDIPKALDQNH